ncbi:hypothetical protein, partial [Escherichia coli]|uniref:hypothetical protein n=1 Tax=Escherichia coli TaxID=562 RepID=UPI001BC90A6D
EKRVFLVILFTSFSGSLVSRISGAVHIQAGKIILSTKLFFSCLRRVDWPPESPDNQYHLNK